MENYPRRLWIAALFSLIIYGTAIAAPNHVARTYNVRDGLPSNSISCVAQDGNGLIWIGTWNGLTFYDGYRFFTFRSGEQSGELSTNRILDIYPDTHGNVWFVTYDHKLGLLDNPTGHFVDVVKFAENALVIIWLLDSIQVLKSCGWVDTTRIPDARPPYPEPAIRTAPIR